jgi:hypothetical protein
LQILLEKDNNNELPSKNVQPQQAGSRELI